MKAIELKSKTDSKGCLKIEYQLDKPIQSVRVLILLQDDDDETLWNKSLSKNPAFQFLNEPCEDVYSLKDGKPFV